MAVFTDTITLYLKRSSGEWVRRVVRGVQWTDKEERENENGKVRVMRYAEITFPVGTYEALPLDTSGDENCILYGEIQEDITGGKLSDLLKKYPKSGVIQSVSDYSGRNFLKHKKVITGTRKQR